MSGRFGAVYSGCMACLSSEGAVCFPMGGPDWLDAVPPRDWKEIGIFLSTIPCGDDD